MPCAVVEIVIVIVLTTLNEIRYVSCSDAAVERILCLTLPFPKSVSVVLLLS